MVLTAVREADGRREGKEKQRNTLACFASRSAALDLAGVPAKIEHRGQHKKGYGAGIGSEGRERRAAGQSMRTRV